MLMKTLTLLFFVLCFSINTSAQITIKGAIFNDSVPLEAANVIIKSSKKVTFANVIGEFKIMAKKGDTLAISHLGYKTKELVVHQNEILRIYLEEDNLLDEVVLHLDESTTTECYSIGCGKTRSCSTSFLCNADSQPILQIQGDIEPIRLHPNPSSNGIFYLDQVQNSEAVKIVVANMAGQIIKKGSYQNFGKKLTIDLSEFPKGIYLITIMSNGQYLETLKAIRS